MISILIIEVTDFSTQLNRYDSWKDVLDQSVLLPEESILIIKNEKLQQIFINMEKDQLIEHCEKILALQN